MHPELAGAAFKAPIRQRLQDAESSAYLDQWATPTSIRLKRNGELDLAPAIPAMHEVRLNLERPAFCSATSVHPP